MKKDEVNEQIKANLEFLRLISEKDKIKEAVDFLIKSGFDPWAYKMAWFSAVKDE